MPSIISRIKVWVDNEILYAADLNGEFNNVVNALVPSSIDDFSNDVSQMQSSVDPGGLGTENLAVNLAGELQRLRFAISRIIKLDLSQQWYEASASSLDDVATLAAKFPVQTADIGDSQVTAVKLASNAVTTVKIVDGNVTKAKLAAVGQQLSASSGGYSTTAGLYNPVTNLSCTITTSGRPVVIMLIPDGNGAVSSSFGGECASGDIFIGTAAVIRGTTLIADFVAEIAAVGTDPGILLPVSSICTVDPVAAGTYTYHIEMKVFSAGMTARMNYAKLLVYEL